MDYFKKIERSVTISADKRSTVDLQVDVWSQDLNVTKFILKLDTTDSTTIDLTNATVRVAMVYNQGGQDVKIEAAGIVEDVATQKIAYIMDDKLAGFEGTVTAGFYVTLNTGQRIDIQNVTFNMRKSLLDKDLEAATESYYQTFDDIVSDVQATGNTAKTQIANVLPSVQSKVSAINTELAKINENMPDLFVAYADDISGSGFSKTDTTKLYKGFGVKNSNLPADYRWEKNVDSLKIGGRNLLKDTASDLYNKKITKDTTSNYTNTLYLVDGFDLNNLINKTVILSFRLKNDGNYEVFNNGNIWYLNNRFGAHMSLIWKNSLTGQTHVINPMTEMLYMRENNKRVYSIYTFTPPDSSYDTLTNLSFAMQIGYKPAQDNNSEWFLGEFKLEEGNTPMSWGPAHEDLILNSNPINSILTTLSSENPSTTLGGTWTQLGNENKFNQTIYYWKRTN